MNTEKIQAELQDLYPDALILLNKDQQGEVCEILCEVEPSADHPSWSKAIAVIDKSSPHKHNVTTETYKVIRGKLTLHMDDESMELTAGEEFVIPPGKVHWAVGDETWIECVSEPGWTLDDYVLI